MKLLIFNGIDTSDLINVNEISGRGPISNEIERLSVPGRPGSFFVKKNIPERILELKIEVVGNSLDDIREKVEVLNQIFDVDEPVPIIFLDEPNKTYYGILENTDWSENLFIGKGSLTFICPDPYKYGPEKSVEFNNTGTVNVIGSVETYPVMKVEVKQDTTYLAVSDGENINLIGNPTEVTQQPYEPETRTFWHECNTTVGWTGTSSIEGGTNKGTLKSNGYAFYTNDYGTDTGWHGPALKTSLGSTLQDFKIDVLITQKGKSGQTGSIEIDALDVNNQIVCKFLMTKRSAGSQANWARLRAGNDAKGHDIINERGDYEWVWANFDGILRITRKGNIWTAYVAQIDKNGQHHSRRLKEWHDTNNLYTAPISQIQVQLWQYGSVPTTDQRIQDIKVFRLNNGTENQVPYVARVGDIIEFDHVNDIIRRNGEDITKEKAFIGNYFPLKPGANAVVVEPADAVLTTEVRWRDRWR
ncbi:phage tail family protein [Neobacillus sedimentimangrovi]|uniref:Phage tail family protein n=1 Tax=Neobacillus sedimentimangrovi TaxID=2699460 RepID=A0ABS8QG06_9BACI|nr:distal tail protein Dit [Neobacillus sedimentimangrovi]MCD4838174.1 phage tail family protein [Neobacillus sedimentimangrovi]